MFKDNIYSTYKYQVKNIEEKNQSFQEKTISVLDYEFVKSFDVLSDITSGAFANRLISVDPLTRSFKITDFNYDKYKASSPPMNGKNNGVTIDNTNRFGLKSTQNPQSLSHIRSYSFCWIAPEYAVVKRGCVLPVPFRQFLHL